MYKILLATDGSEHSLNATETTLNLAGMLKAEVTALYVYTPTFIGRGGPGCASGKDVETMRNDLDESKALYGEEILTELAKRFGEKGVDINTLSMKGHPVDIINKIAEEGQYNLIVIGRRGISNIKRTFLGSVSNGVIQSAKTNVLLVK